MAACQPTVSGMGQQFFGLFVESLGMPFMFIIGVDCRRRAKTVRGLLQVAGVNVDIGKGLQGLNGALRVSHGAVLVYDVEIHVD